MSIGFWQIAIVVVLVVLLFGRGKISDLMGDVAKGIKSFKKGMKDPELNNSIRINIIRRITFRRNTFRRDTQRRFKSRKKINRNATNWMV